MKIRWGNWKEIICWWKGHKLFYYNSGLTDSGYCRRCGAYYIW